MKLDHLCIPHTRINSKWTKDLNVIPETIKIVEDNWAAKSQILLIAIFYQISLQARETEEKINKWDYIKLKGFCTAKENINKIKRQLIEWEKIFTETSDKGLISKIYKENGDNCT